MEKLPMLIEMTRSGRRPLLKEVKPATGPANLETAVGMNREPREKEEQNNIGAAENSSPGRLTAVLTNLLPVRVVRIFRGLNCRI
jgi:hypothetical protein